MFSFASVQANARVILTSLMKHVGIAAVLCTVFGAAAHATTLPSGFTETLIASGLSNPTAMAIAPDGRVLVCLQGGQLRVIKNDELLPTPFLTVSVNASGERGLLGIAFDPAFATNHFVYVYYTTSTSPIHNRVSRFTSNGDVADAGSEVPILDLENLSATNHNGGAIHFGIDGKLYVAVGENAVRDNSQTLNNRLGKLLRINADGTIPTDNPFYSTATGANRAIWALGLRNPFTFSVQPGSGRIFINDVGQSTWEEINDGVAGASYGWPTTEGPTSDPRFNGPLFAYDRRGTGECAITGGAFYNPLTQQFPAEYAGAYFYADFCGGWIRRLDPSTATSPDFATDISLPVDLQVDDDGSLLYLARGAGAVYRVTFASTTLGSLVVTQLTGPAGASSGGSTLQVKDTTANTGNGNADASETGIWLSTNTTLENDTLLASRSVPALASGQTSKGTTAVTLPSLSPGTYYLLAQADTNSRVDESHEGDNLRTTQLRVGPDLLASIALQPATSTSTSPTTITVTTTNLGFDVAAASTTQLYMSTDATVGSGDTLLRTWSIAALNPTQASGTSVSVTLPPGTYYLLAVVDATNVVSEANEAQNVRRLRVVVQ